MSRTKLPFEVKIEKPCTQSWDDMTGTAAERHCESCRKQVHNFAELTPRQIERLLIATGGELCAQLTYGQDGSLTTLEPDRPSNRYAVAALSATLAFAPMAAHAQNTPGSYMAVTGTITDSQGAILVGSTVDLIHEGATLGTTTTNEAGEFAFAAVPGTYLLKIESPGFAPASKSLVVTADHAATTDISLKPGADISVQVTAELPTQSYTTGGALVANFGPWYKRIGYRLRHPVAYTEYLFRKR